MPNGQDLEPAAADPVVDPVLNPVEVKASHALRTGLRDNRAETRLFNEQGERSLQIFSHRTRCSRAVDCPPLGNAIEFSCCSFRDVQLERHRSPVASQLLEQLLASDGLAAIGFSEARFELRQFVGRQTDWGSGLT